MMYCDHLLLLIRFKNTLTYVRTYLLTQQKLKCGERIECRPKRLGYFCQHTNDNDYISKVPITFEYLTNGVTRTVTISRLHQAPTERLVSKPSDTQRSRKQTGNGYWLVNEADGDSERPWHVVQRQTTVRFQQLLVGEDPHLPRVVSVVRRQVAIVLQRLLDLCWNTQQITVIYSPDYQLQKRHSGHHLTKQRRIWNVRCCLNVTFRSLFLIRTSSTW